MRNNFPIFFSLLWFLHSAPSMEVNHRALVSYKYLLLQDWLPFSSLHTLKSPNVEILREKNRVSSITSVLKSYNSGWESADVRVLGWEIAIAL